MTERAKSKPAYRVRQRPKLCYHIDIRGEFPGISIDPYSLRTDCEGCVKFVDWIGRVWDDAAPKKRGSR